MKIVKFDNGKWAVKRGWWVFSEYLDNAKFNINNNYWWFFAVDNSFVDSFEIAIINLENFRKKENKVKIILSYKA